MKKDEYIATVIKYVNDKATDVATGNFEQILNALAIERIEKNIYFKLAKYNDIPNNYIEDIHFGCLCKKRSGLKITEGIYCNAYLNNQFKRYFKYKKIDESWQESFLLLVRFYLYFQEATRVNLNNKYFKEWTQTFFTENTWQKVCNLNDFKKVSGIYALVLDEYDKCYIGQAVDIKKRVLEHWRKDSFVTKGIDLFRAKDTTRIYVIPLCLEKLDQSEYDYVSAIPSEYRLNFLQGGSIDFHEKSRTSLFFEDNKIGNSFFETREKYYEYLERKEKEMQHFFE
ncbi:MAG: GIY-YIG nuclease family protein [Lachnospiraceae bacterium]|nr:GIY-YIG nuclease family protein [Lachnospiraceae bacterium]